MCVRVWGMDAAVCAYGCGLSPSCCFHPHREFCIERHPRQALPVVLPWVAELAANPHTVVRCFVAEFVGEAVKRMPQCMWWLEYMFCREEEVPVACGKLRTPVGCLFVSVGTLAVCNEGVFHALVMLLADDKSGVVLKSAVQCAPAVYAALLENGCDRFILVISVCVFVCCFVCFYVSSGVCTYV